MNLLNRRVFLSSSSSLLALATATAGCATEEVVPPPPPVPSHPLDGLTDFSGTAVTDYPKILQRPATLPHPSS